MTEAGVNLATVGVFSWAWLEPAPGEFAFGWLREVLDLLHGAGIDVALGTPTASPAALAVGPPPGDAAGHRGRRALLAWQPPALLRAQPGLPAACVRITERLARELGDHPAVRLWHLHNEYACHIPACYCDVSAAAFRDWLRRRYGSTDALNEAWGTAFWSQRYRDFAEVLPPRVTPAHPTRPRSWTTTAS